MILFGKAKKTLSLQAETIQPMSQHIIDAQLFEKLFRDKYEQLYYFAYDYVEDEEVARDTVSETFAMAWKNRNNIDTAKIVSYLHTAVRNRCLDHLRHEKRKNRFEESYPTLYTEVDSDEWREREELIAAVQAEIRRLPERTQWVLRQRYEQHRSYQDIADELGISLNGMKKLMSRTFQHLRDALNAKNNKNIYTNRKLIVILLTMFG